MDKKNAQQLFNHAKALETSHGDEAIALKLRQMFINNLSNELEQAVNLWRTKSIEDLQSHLHHVLGGAQVCAAESLIDYINQVKQELNREAFDIDRINNLWLQLEEIKSAMLALKHSTDN